MLELSSGLLLHRGTGVSPVEAVHGRDAHATYDLQSTT